MRKEVHSSTHVSVDGYDAPITQDMLDPSSLEGAPFGNPLSLRKPSLVERGFITDDKRYMTYDPHVTQNTNTLKVRLASVHGHLHFNPTTAVVGIVTCGGLCPGINDVIRGITLAAIQLYGVKRVIGFTYGLWGLSAAGRKDVRDLTPSVVASIHRIGGTFLGSSRGPQNMGEVIETLQLLGVNVLFAIGGDGTQKALLAMSVEARRRGVNVALIGVPKSIDNDLCLSHRTFGFETAVDQAVHVIRAAHAEAKSHNFGIGLVQLMGRHSGFIAAHASVASTQVHVCLIPENPISLDTVLRLVDSCLQSRSYCVVVVAEGFGQNWPEATGGRGTDASGNAKLFDIGVLLKKYLENFLASSAQYREGCVKYLSPTYFIRSCATNASDASFCTSLATFAVHEGMAGTTEAVITMWYSNLIVVPIRTAVSLRRVVSLYGQLWLQLRQITVDPVRAVKNSGRHPTVLHKL